MTIADWAEGDMMGLPVPAHADALRAGGEAYLTRAFRAGGVLADDNRVLRIEEFRECFGGRTGRKLLLSATYEKPGPELHADLFVKFSRNPDDDMGDQFRHMLDSEVQFASLARLPGFPIAVAKCYFADFNRASGTGILITERIAYGSGGIEPHYPKCLDYDMPEPLEHYRALVKTLARLSGTHKAGRLSPEFDRRFPRDIDKLIASDRLSYTPARLQNRVSRFAAFVAEFPQLFPENIAAPDFIACLSQDVARFAEHELAIRRYLHGRPEFIALCHWNANIDNAWFWRNAQGALEAGLLDWAQVGQMSVAASLYGALSGCDIDIWDAHMDQLVGLFAEEFHACGGPVLDVRALRLHLDLFTAMMGLAYLMDAPPLIRAELPDLARAQSRFDPQLRTNEWARVQLHMMTMLLNQWRKRDFGALLDGVLRHA